MKQRGYHPTQHRILTCQIRFIESTSLGPLWCSILFMLPPTNFLQWTTQCLYAFTTTTTIIIMAKKNVVKCWALCDQISVPLKISWYLYKTVTQKWVSACGNLICLRYLFRSTLGADLKLIDSFPSRLRSVFWVTL